MSSFVRAPNFFIVGAAKCGTTALYHYLSQHPDVYLSPIKEPNHFATDILFEELDLEVKKRLELLQVEKYIDGEMPVPIHRAFIKDRDMYLRLFRFVDKEKAVGEASVSYLYSEKAAIEIQRFNPHSRIIILLRDPVERAFSHYLMDIRIALTKLPFEEALEEDRKRMNKTWGASSLYLELGFYGKQVLRYLEAFPKEQVLLLTNDELRNQPQITLDKVCSFLRIEPHTFEPTRESNSSSLPRNRFVSTLIRSNYLRIKVRRSIRNRFVKSLLKHLLFKRKNGRHELSLETRKRLNSLYSKDLTLLFELTGIDLRPKIMDS